MLVFNLYVLPYMGIYLSTFVFTMCVFFSFSFLQNCLVKNSVGLMIVEFSLTQEKKHTFTLE